MIPKNTKIAHKDLLEVISYDPQTGDFAWRNPNWRHAKTAHEMGTIDQRGRRYIHIYSKAYAAHRLAWFYVNAEWPRGNVMPKNGDYLDCRIDNLHIESPSETARRSKDKASNTSGFRGVSWDKSRGKWIATIRANHRQISLGRFDTKEDAAAAFERARSEIYANPIIPHDIEKRREASRKYARYRAIWKRVLKSAAHVTGWDDVNAFIADIGDDLRDTFTPVPIDATKPIGPGNWKWDLALYQQFDTSTPEGKKAYAKASREKNPNPHKDWGLRKSFGITLVEYRKMFDAQSGVCASCGEPETETRGGKLKALAVDHCHSGGEIRGLLCCNCNKGLGHFKDSPTLLRKAADYLERHAAKSSGASTTSLAIS